MIPQTFGSAFTRPIPCAEDTASNAERKSIAATGQATAELATPNLC